MSWPLGTVSEIAEIISGYAFKSEWFGSGFDKVIRIGDLQDGRVQLDSALCVDAKINNVSSQFKIRPKDILMALSGATVGKIAIAQERDAGAYINQRVAIIRGKTPEAAEFLKYVFSGALQEKLLLSAGGAAQPNLSPKSLALMEIPLPPLAEQKRIAAILDKADAIRRKRQQAIKLADEFLRSVFLDMFGDPVTNPKGLKKAVITKLADVITGYAFKSAEYVEESESAVRLCRGANTLTGYFDWKDTAYWSKDKLTNLEDFLLKKNDVVLAMDRPWISSGLKVCIVNEEDPPMYLVQRVARLRPKSPEYADFIYACIKSNSFVSHCCPTETTVPHISPVELKNFVILIPEDKEIKKYHGIVSHVRKASMNMLNSELGGSNLFNSLNQKAFSGSL